MSNVRLSHTEQQVVPASCKDSSRRPYYKPYLRSIEQKLCLRDSLRFQTSRRHVGHRFDGVKAVEFEGLFER